MKKSTKIIIAVVSVLAVAAIVFAVLFFATDLFKTKNPKKGFYESLDKVATSEVSYSDVLAGLKKVGSQSYEGKGKMSMNIELGSMISNEQYENIVKVLNAAEINYVTQIEADQPTTYTTMNLKYDGKDLGTAELIVDSEKIGLKVKEITDKYLTMSIEDIMEELNLDVDTSIKLNSTDIELSELIDLLDVSDSEIKRITDRYKKVLEDVIPESNYSSTKEKITVNGKEINATAYSVKISEKDLTKLATKMLESLKEDDSTIDLIQEKVNKIMSLTGQSTMKLTKSQIKSAIEAGMSEISDSNELNGKEVKITVYENKDEIVRVQFEVGDDAIIIDSQKDGDTTNMALKAKTDGTEMNIMNVESTKKGDNKYSTKLSTDIEGMKIEITMDTETADSTSKINAKIYVDVQSMIKATLNIEEEIAYKSVNVEKLSSRNTIDVNSMTSTEQKELTAGLLKYMDSHMDVIKEIATTLGYEDEIAQIATQLNALKSSSTTQTVNTTDTTSDDTDAEE